MSLRLCIQDIRKLKEQLQLAKEVSRTLSCVLDNTEAHSTGQQKAKFEQQNKMLHELNSVLEARISSLEHDVNESKSRIQALEERNRELEARFHSTGPSGTGEAFPRCQATVSPHSQGLSLTRHGCRLFQFNA